MLVYSLVLLSAFGSSVLAGKAGPLKGEPDISPRQIQECRTPGWIPVCPGDLPCIPPSGTCCEGDYYHLPGETCPDGYSEVPRLDQTTPPSASITPAPSPSSIPDTVAVDYTWYTYSFTFFYTYYYYYYFETAYEITSTETTYYTTYSFTATDDAAATSVVEAISAEISEGLVSQTETPTVTASVAPASTTVPRTSSRRTTTSSEDATASEDATSSRVAPPTVGTTTTGARPSLPTQFSGAAASLRAGSFSGFGTGFALALGALGVAPAMLMLLL